MTETAPHLAPFQCATHPEVETYLRCGKCDKPICPRCMVQTPVGARCRACAQLRRLPQFDVSADSYLKAGAAALAAAMVAGLLWSTVPGFPFVNYLAAGLSGWAIGEAVTRASRYRSSTGLKVLAGAGLVLAFVLSEVAAIAWRGVPLGALPALAGPVVLRALANPFVWLPLALGIYFAVSRIR